MPPRRRVFQASSGAHRHPELRGQRVTELDEEEFLDHSDTAFASATTRNAPSSRHQPGHRPRQPASHQVPQHAEGSSQQHRPPQAPNTQAVPTPARPGSGAYSTEPNQQPARQRSREPDMAFPGGSAGRSGAYPPTAGSTAGYNAATQPRMPTNQQPQQSFPARSNGGRVKGALRRGRIRAEMTDPYSAALFMTIIFAIIWGSGLIGFGIMCKS